MSDSWLQCISCGSRYELAPSFFGCPSCLRMGTHYPLEVRYSAESIEADPVEQGVWRWSSLLPPIPRKDRVSLRENTTSLLSLESSRLRATTYLKNETTNPTWSWKDRPNTVSVSMAKHFGLTRVVARSTGNHGSSVAAYAAAGGMTSIILCTENAPQLQLALMEGYGAQVIRG